MGVRLYYTFVTWAYCCVVGKENLYMTTCPCLADKIDTSERNRNYLLIYQVEARFKYHTRQS